MRLFVLPIALCGLVVQPAFASEIGSGNDVRPSWNVHESITKLASNCLAKSPLKPEDCEAHPRSILGIVVQSGQQMKDQYFEEGTRWPDDPLRMLRNDAGRVLFAVTLAGKCKRALAKGPKIDQRGLLCASHFGPIQFAHSQDNLAEPGRPQSPAEREASQRKMLQWARFAFRAAADPAFARLPLCHAVADTQFDAIATSLSLANSERCNGHYTVARLFSWRCTNFGICSDLSSGGNHFYVMQGAAGAILHLIQDSYSQSHAARVPSDQQPPMPSSVFPSLSACRPIATFYDYSGQMPAEGDKFPSDTHGNADKPPLIDAGCFEAENDIDDVITASARALWLVQQARNPRVDVRLLEEELVSDLKTRVLVLRVAP